MEKNPNRKLLFSVTGADCIKDTFCTGGPGGQAQNKKHTGVRFTHPPSGAVGESREHRSQEMNKRAAWTRMCQTKRFVTWVKVEAARRRGEKSVDDLVKQTLTDDNVKTEVLDQNSKWQPRKPAELKGDES